MTRVPRYALALGLACLSLAGCGSGSGAQDPTSSTDASPVESSSTTPTTVCALMSKEDVVKLVGDKVGDPQALMQNGVPYCRWDDTGADLPTSAILWSSSAIEWAKSMDTTIPDASSGAPPEVQEAITILNSGLADGSLTDEQACAAFSILGEARGGAKGADTSVDVQPAQGKPALIAVGMCRDGRYTSLQVNGPGFEASGATVADVTAVVEKIQASAS